ncbi:MAG: hypothetical protein ACPGYT_11015 [Nitrospirales bacterium]
MTMTRFMKGLVLATTLTFTSTLVQLPMAWASSTTSQAIDMEITVKVNQKGFLNKKGKIYTKKNILKLPKGKVVRINFVFDESMSSLAYGDTHQVAITGKNGTQEAEKIWMWNTQSSITFQAGEEGSKYRAYCILDCIGMEHLNNLVIHVV